MSNNSSGMIGFKPVKMFDEIIQPRAGSSHTKRDPLLFEYKNSGKRSRMDDGSAMQIYRETDEERKARNKLQKKAEKQARKNGGLMSEEEVLMRMQMEDHAEKPAEQAAQSASVANLAEKNAKLANRSYTVENNILKFDTGWTSKLEEEDADGSGRRRGTSGSVGLAPFKDKLKASGIAEAAEASEKKHKQDEATKHRGLLDEAAARAVPGADPDEKVSFSEIWKEGDEESAADWLNGGGLKFHTTADKAFSMASGRFKESAESKAAAAENREAVADLAKKRGEIKMAEFRNRRAV